MDVSILKNSIPKCSRYLPIAKRLYPSDVEKSLTEDKQDPAPDTNTARGHLN